MDKFSGNSRSGSKPRIAAIVFALSLLVASALPLLPHSSADDQRDHKRNASVAAKRSSDRATKNDSPPNYQNPGFAQQLLDGGGRSGRILATADFDLIGLAVTATPATQAVPKNTPTAILTSVQAPPGTDPAQIIAGLNPNYRVRGDLSGPSLTSPVSLEAKIGDPLPIPTLARAGDHAVQNLRVVDISVTGTPVVAPVTPDTCGIVVIEQLLISQVRVEEMSYDDIVRSGIAISDDSYRFFNFVLAFATSSGVQYLNAPVAFPPVGAEAPLPVVGRVTPPAGIGINVPDVVPVMLQTVGGGDEEEGGGTKLEFADHAFSIPGVVVFPGRIGLLNQFFEAIVIVANGAPTGTPLVVRNLHARAALPDNGTPADSTDDPLRIARTQVGGQVTDLALHGLGADGQYGTPDDTTRFLPGESGQGTFLLEGLKEGLHTPKFILEGTLDGLPVGPVTVRGEVPGSVLVRDASFAATFTHPSVVRAGQEYDLALTVFNTGSRDILGAIARLNANSISGAELLANDTGERPFATTIRKKDSSTVVWRLRSNTTGAVSASYVKVGQGIEAGIVLKTGVGDRNVPLSPDTLALPDPVKYLPPGTLATARELLGQAWSVATAPPGTLPQGVTPITKQIVVDRASELGSAGMRIAFNEPANVSVETVMRDWLGELQTNPDAGFADAQRDTPAGFRWFDSIGTSLYARLTSGQPAVTSAALHAELAAAESPRSAFISALVSQPSGPATFGARLIDPAGRRIGFGASATERLGELQSGASLQLSSADGTATTGQMILASRPIDGQWTLELNGWQSGAADVSLLVPLSGHTYRQIIFSGVQVSSGGRYRVTFRPTNSSTPVLEEFVNGSFRASTTTATITTLNEPAPRLIGAIQISPELIGGGDKYGRLVGLLFSKPMSQSSAETATRYKIGGGELVGSNPPQIVGGAIKVGLAKIDPLGGRFVYLSLLSPIGPYIRRDLTLTGVTDVRGVDISPAATNAAITIKVSFQGNPPGAYLTGRVLNADGTPVANSSVEWRAPICSGSIDLGQTVNTQFTDSQGRYGIDYVRNGDCGSPTFIATNPVNGAKKRIGTPVVYDGQHLVIDLVFLARGKVSGTVTISGSPAPNAFVRVVPLIDAGDARVLQADGAGRYLTEDVPVGNVSVLAQGAGSQSASTGFNSGTISGPGQTAVVNVSLQPLSGTARGRVVNPDAGQTPASGTLVVAWARPTGVQTAEVPTGFAYSNRDGSFTISNLPLTDARLEATDYITGLRVNTNIQLSQATREVNAILITLPGYGTVTGRVVNETGGFIPNAAVSGGGSQVLADALGFFTLNRLTAGNQTILAKEPLSGMTGSAAVTVLLGQTTAGVTIVITRPGTINGQVFVQGASGATPIAKAKVCVDGFHIVETDAQGRYTLSNVMPNSQLILRFVHPGLRLAVNTPTFVAPGETITRNATFRASTLRGKISQPDGAGAVAQLKMYVPLPVVTEGLGDFGLIGGADPIQTQSSSDGSYLVANLNPGSYRVTASSAFFPTKVSKIGTVLVSQEEICDITLVSTFAGKIQGRVFQPDGTTLAGAGIKVALGGGALANVTVQTDPAGHYEFAEVFAAGAYVMTATENATGNTNQIGISVRQNEDCVADIRLLGRGGLRVRVIDGAGVAVQGAQVNVNGTAYPHASRFGETTAPSNGVILFDNLNEGNYAVTATQSGISGRASASVPRGSTVEVTVQFQPSGTIEGRVLMPDGSTGVGLADVQLQINSRTLGVTVTSDAEGEVGKFTFLNVPAGDYTVEAFDNRTTRVGRSSVRITTQGQTASADIKLVALGAVTGRVTVNGAAVDHAAVLLTASGFVSTRLLATTTADGRYRFTGIPVGQFNVSVTNGPGGLTGSATGSIVGTIEPLADTTADIALTPSVTVTGTVSQFGGLQPAGGARVRLTVGGRWFDVLTDQIGTYRVEWVPLGDISVRAQAATGFDRGVAPVATASTAGATLTINVTLVGTGTITGEARDSDGITRLTSGSVKFTNSEIGDPVVLNAAVQSNGRYQISGAPAGAFTLSLTVPNRVGAGTANGALTANETLDLNVKLEDAGTITGAVKTAAALPVNSADITLTMQRPAGIVRFYAHTSPQGIYLFENIPLGTGSIAVLDTASGGLANASGISLTTNAQTFNVPDLILDSTPIRVDAVVPANGAVNVPRNSAVTITFSEPVLASTINSTNLKLLQGATAIGSSLAISPDGKTVTLTPAALADFTSYTIVVTTNVKDLVGLRLESEFRSSFVTRDETGPLVVAVNPLNNAVQVALTTDVQVTFDEAIDAAQNLLSVVKLSLGATPVAGTVTLGGNGTVATFRPTSALIESTLYTINVVGQRDVFQNVTTAPAIVSSFTTVDLTPPVVDPLPIDGARLQTFTPAITATYHDNLTGINTASVVLKLDNTTVTSGVSVTAAGLTFTPSSPLAKGNHTVTVQVADNAGNLSAIRSATFSIDDSAPVIASFTIGGVNAVNGMSVSSTLRPVFAATYSDDSGISIANTKLLFGPAGSTPPQVAATVTATSLTFQPAANLAEGQYTAQLIVVDTIGNTTTAGQLAVTIDVDAAEITTVTPSHGNQHGSTTVVLTGNRLLNSAGTPPASVILGGYAAQVTGAVAGSPDQLTIVTPAGAPGAATITISTDRGVGSLVGGFIYDADPKTPFAVEPDTLLLWHLDETANGAVTVLDAGQLTQEGTAGSVSQAATGRFGGARLNASITGEVDLALLSPGSSSLTAECWIKSAPVPRTYVLIGKSRTPFGDFDDFNLLLLPSGALQGYLYDTGNRLWTVTTPVTPATSDDVDDGQWHSIAMVVDRAANKLSIYVDGAERESAGPPTGFVAMRNQGHPFGAGHYLNAVGGTGPAEFPGVLDEIRLSNTAHTADVIQRTYLGTQGSLGLYVSTSAPSTIARGTATDFVARGYNLSNLNATFTDSSGAQIPAQVIATSATHTLIRMSPGSGAALGVAQLVLSSPAGSIALQVYVVDLERNLYGVEADTLLLWHLDEPGNGAARVIDSGAFSFDATAGTVSQAVAGRFSGGRSNASIAGDTDSSTLSPGAASFTAECWMKTDPVPRTYVLIGKSRTPFGDFDDFNLLLLPSGALQGYLYDTGNRLWSVIMPATSSDDVDDGRWHSVAMVVDRGASKLSIYVDGVERASGGPPAGFVAMRNQGWPFGAGHYLSAVGGTGPAEFPGVLDEIRLSGTAHTATRVLEDFRGNSGLRVTSYGPKEVGRDRAVATPHSTQLTIVGYNLENVSAHVVRDGQPIDVGVALNDSSYRQAHLTLSVGQSVSLGPAQVILSKASQPDVALNVQITEESLYAVEEDTLLLWHLDEPANGAARVVDSGPLSIDGTAGTISQAVAGRFNGGRSNASITADTDIGALSLGAASFTAECWMKTDPVPRTYVLIGKSRTPFGDFDDFSLLLLPSGALQGYLYDTGNRLWSVIMPATSSDDVDDGQWHSVAMVVDRGASKLSIYVDGVERASGGPPAGFVTMRNQGWPFGAGHYLNAAGGSGPAEFPGVLDEIRLSSTAHSAAKISSDFFGFNGVRVTSVSPSIVQRGAMPATFRFYGTGLTGATVTSSVSGAAVSVTSTSYTRLDFTLGVPGTTSPGPLSLTVRDSLGQITTAELTVVDQQPFTNDPAGSSETILLWHLDEAGNAAVPIIGSGDPVLPAVIGGSAAAISQAAAGRFGGARVSASIAGDSSSSSYSIASSSFTAECWMKSDPGARTYVLVGKSRTPFGDFDDFNLLLLPSGGVQGYLYDNGNRLWSVTVEPVTYDASGQSTVVRLDDGQWHLVSMVVDRTASKLSLFVDGVERASGGPPAGFGAMRNQGWPLGAGHYLNAAGGTGPAEFPGTLDEIRIVNFARTAAQIHDTWFGTTTTGLNTTPLRFFKSIEPVFALKLGQDSASQPRPPTSPPGPQSAARSPRTSRATGGGR